MAALDDDTSPRSVRRMTGSTGDLAEPGGCPAMSGWRP